MTAPGRPFWVGASFTLAAGLGIFFVFERIVGRDGDLNVADAYSLMPLFLVLGGLCAVLYRIVARSMDFPRQGLGFVMGCLAGGALAGALALWLVADDRPLENRFVISVFGGAMLGGFFPWIGALLMHASRQSVKAPT